MYWMPELDEEFVIYPWANNVLTFLGTIVALCDFLQLANFPV